MSNRALLAATAFAILVAAGLFVIANSSDGRHSVTSPPDASAMPLKIDIPLPPTQVVAPDAAQDRTTALRDRKIQPLRTIAKAVVTPVRAARESRVAAGDTPRMPVRTIVRAPARLLGRLLRR